MERMIFPNLPVADLKAAERFYLGLGFTKDPQFSNDDAAAMVISDSIVVMLLQQDFYQGFLPQGDTPHLGSSGKEVLNCISCESRDEVDRILAACQTGGGAVYAPAEERMPGMYSGSATDPDGHVWEFMWMDPAGVEEPERTFEVSSNATVQEQNQAL
ncbi:lactoylglutathione lyase [Arthrobacter zhangbolii]|uniref:Lactoylglutathione lyase n=1 Tax=Arthrobacter zhangbolii TaxID=2886936 RepID=A0A9X1M893_9MICC|nr:VOC family protein [Arthrobacter zhangbolii]MCC3272149.1 lactoylglutathione lyase [Arthrobacter zhangbolii]UON91977.1 lactoylglutathione lyase [Arthrobacter zhangbolii]